MRILGCVAFSVFLLGATQASAQPPAPAPATPETIPPPAAQVHPKSACAASSAATHEEHVCPTCGHESGCASCDAKKQGCFTKFYHWATYRGERPGKDCRTIPDPRHSPLYAWFPCSGGDCGSCADGDCANGRTNGGLACRLHGLKNCAACRSCAKGQCGAFWFVGRCKVNYPAQQQNCGCGSTAHDGPEMFSPAAAPSTPATPPTPAAVDPLAPPPMAPIQQTTYKKDANSATQDTAALKPVAQKRISTYRPDLMPNAMPVLSPDQFRKKSPQ